MSKTGDKKLRAMPKPKAKPPAFKPTDIPLTPQLSSAKVTPKGLAAGNYQRKLAAHFAPYLLPKMFQSLCSLVEQGNTTALRMVGEMFEFVQKSSAVSIINNNNVDNRSVKIEAAGDSESRSFESVQRLLAIEREKRYKDLSPGVRPALDVKFEDTPEGLSQ